jgi:hypothetical protein
MTLLRFLFMQKKIDVNVDETSLYIFLQLYSHYSSVSRSVGVIVYIVILKVDMSVLVIALDKVCDLKIHTSVQTTK